MSLQKSKFGATILGTIRDKDGRILRVLPEVEANSFVKAFIDMLYKHFSQETLAIVETDGTSIAHAPFIEDLEATAGVGITGYGIVVGTGTNAVTVDDICLQTQVTANIAHGAVTVSEPVTVGNARQLDIARTFINNTGALLEIKEVGLYIITASTAYVYCLDRSLYSFEVSDGESISLRYRIKVTV